MDLILQATSWIIGGFLAAMFSIVAIGMLTGRINTTGLLTVRDAKGRFQMSPQRVQLLLMTLAGAGQYLGSVISHPGRTLPEAPKELLALLGASHVAYLGSKGYYSLLKKD